MEYKLKDCEIKLTQLKVPTVSTKYDSDTNSSLTEKLNTPEMSGDDSNEIPPVLSVTTIPSSRPKRKVIKPINYSEQVATEVDTDDTRAAPKPKRGRPSLSNPSSRCMAAQKPRSIKTKPDTPTPQIKHERDKQPDKPVKFIAPKDQPRNTRANRKVSPRSATPAKSAPSAPTPSATVSDKTDLKCDINIRFKGLLKHLICEMPYLCVTTKTAEGHTSPMMNS